MIQKSRLFYFDFTRAIAVLMVSAVHSAQITSKAFIHISIWELGRFGVQLFFIISGATVYMSYVGILKKYEQPILVFLIRRFFRILPLFIIMGVGYSISKSIPIYNVLSPTALFSPYYINSIPGGWSIWNELFFYSLFPLYFLIRSSNIKSILFLVFFNIYSFVLNFRYFGLIENDSFYETYDYENFGSQIILFIIGIEFAAKNYKRISILLIVNLIPSIMLKIAFFPNALFKTDFGANYWISLIAISCILLLFLSKKIVLNRFLSSESFIGKFFGEIGKMTYSMYMIHFIVIYFLRSHLENLYAEVSVLIITSITVVISYIVKPYSEEIWSNLGRKLIKKII
tara:strand:- start:1136 stop:2164 length:1029 start_codon:yes stop_codon:yes gene_type:complete